MRSIEDLRRRLARLRRTEYTGEDRCWPCTVLNLVMVAVVGVMAWLVSPWLGLATLVTGTLLVYVRGYAVPGTPSFAPRIAGRLPVSFGHDGPDPRDSGSLSDERDPEATMEGLLESGVLVPDGDELFLDDAFRAAWDERMAELRELPGSELAARAAAASGDEVDGSYHSDRVLLAGGRDAWLSPAVAIAETAAVEALAERGVPAPLRIRAARPLRTFLRTCPVCGGAVRETTYQNCCGGPGSVSGRPDRSVLACGDCDTVAFVFPPEDGGDGAA